LHSVENLVKKSVTDSHRPFGDENNLENLLVLVLDELSARLNVVSGLEVLHKGDQKLPQLGIVPGYLVAGHTEVLFVVIQKVCEKIIDKDLALHIVRQLIHEPLAALALDGREPIVLPEVIEEVFDLCDQLLVERISVIEPGQQSNPLREVLVVADNPQRFIVHQNVDELSHDE
jgi:hypothetical protein